MLSYHTFKPLNLNEPIVTAVKRSCDIANLFFGEVLLCAETVKEIVDKFSEL